MSIGANVRRLRTGRNLSQRELAEAVGVTQPMIAQIERGTKALTLELGKEISEILHVSVNDLLTDAEPVVQGRPPAFEDGRPERIIYGRSKGF